VLGILILAACLLLGFAGLQAGLWRAPAPMDALAPVDAPSLAAVAVPLGPAPPGEREQAPAPPVEPDQGVTLYLPLLVAGAPLRPGAPVQETAEQGRPLVLPDPRLDVPPSLARSVRDQAARALAPLPPVKAAPGRSSQDVALGEGRWLRPVHGELSLSYSPSHRAIDVVSSHGALVVAADAGEVVYAEWETSGYGYLVIVDHGDGYRTYYGHLYGFYVDVGEQVARGALLGQLGTTGHSTGPHLHFEIRYQGVHRNPLDLLPPDPLTGQR
jgi:murein DD-endopeptidase MepM/ murein hydrolase activator NlpD